jgi:hypothetical protein
LREASHHDMITNEIQLFLGSELSGGRTVLCFYSVSLLVMQEESRDE